MNKELEINQYEYNKVMIKYFNTIIFIMYYYFKGCPDNNYYYPYISGILLSDFYEFIKDNNLLTYADKKFSKKKYTKIYPLQQLITVLPKQSYYLLPYNIKSFLLSNNKNILLENFIKYYLPDIQSIKRDFINKSKIYQANLILKMPHIDDINAIIGNIGLSNDDINRTLKLE